MKTLTPILAAIALSFSATTVLADGQADQYDEARTYPHKTVQTDTTKKACD